MIWCPGDLVSKFLYCLFGAGSILKIQNFADLFYKAGG